MPNTVFNHGCQYILVPTAVNTAHAVALVDAESPAPL